MPETPESTASEHSTTATTTPPRPSQASVAQPIITTHPATNTAKPTATTRIAAAKHVTTTRVAVAASQATTKRIAGTRQATTARITPTRVAAARQGTTKRIASTRQATTARITPTCVALTRQTSTTCIAGAMQVAGVERIIATGDFCAAATHFIALGFIAAVERALAAKQLITTVMRAQTTGRLVGRGCVVASRRTTAGYCRLSVEGLAEMVA
jgi:hypothetical protein